LAMLRYVLQQYFTFAKSKFGLYPANIAAIILKIVKIYKHLFFDLDNTLWDFRANAREAFLCVFEKLDLFGRIPDFEAFIATYEKYNEHLWDEYRKGQMKKDHMRSERMLRTFSEMGINDPDLADKAGELYVREAPLKTHLFPMVRETLHYLSNKYSLYILTNGFAEIQIQ
jgi:putative hydrolase of the HAD superfamily